MPHSQWDPESGLASEGVEAAGVPGAGSQVTQAEHSRVFVSAAPPPPESAAGTGHDRAQRAPELPSVTPMWLPAFLLRGKNALVH